jgi:hypothetical protein
MVVDLIKGHRSRPFFSPFKFKNKDNLEDEGAKYPDDCYSFIAQGWADNKGPFDYGLFVFSFQTSFLALMICSKMVRSMSSEEDIDNAGEQGFAGFIPANASLVVRTTQFLSIMAFLIFAEASMNDVATAVRYFPLPLLYHIHVTVLTMSEGRNMWFIARILIRWILHFIRYERILTDRVLRDEFSHLPIDFEIYLSRMCRIRTDSYSLRLSFDNGRKTKLSAADNDRNQIAKCRPQLLARLPRYVFVFATVVALFLFWRILLGSSYLSSIPYRTGPISISILYVCVRQGPKDPFHVMQ